MAQMTQKYSNTDNTDGTDDFFVKQYQIPEDECPVCHKKVESFESRSIDLLFTRANLPNGMASIRE